MRTGFCPAFVIMPILLTAGMACGGGPLCGSSKMMVMCVPAARYVPWPYLQGCMFPKRAGFPGGLAGGKFLRSAQNSSHVFRRLHRPDGLFRSDCQPPSISHRNCCGVRERTSSGDAATETCFLTAACTAGAIRLLPIRGL